LLVPLWLAGAVAAYHWLPGYSQAEVGSSELVSPSLPAVRAEIASDEQFGFPFSSQAVLVQHDRSGLPARARTDAAELALRIDDGSVPGHGPLVAAVAYLDSARAPGASGPPGTTELTFLYFRPSTSPFEVQRVIGRLIRASRPTDYVGATGIYPAEEDQGGLIASSLRLVELAAIGVVFVTVGAAFRSLVAPLIVAVTVGIAYVVGEHVLAFAALRGGFALPGELEPLIVILVVGVVTDYSVFFLSAQRSLLASSGLRPLGAARVGAAKVMPLVAAAGTTVAGGTGTLALAHLQLYRQLGPGMAISVAVAVVVSITFVPAAVALSGRVLFWPAPPARPRRWSGRDRLARVVMRLPVSVVVLSVGVGLLAWAATGLGGLRLGLDLVSDLPAGSGAAQASQAAAAGFAPGIIDPTVLAVSGSGVASDRGRLGALGRDLARQPDVAAVIGAGRRTPRPLEGAFVSKRHDAARYLIVLDSRPLGARAIDAVGNLRRRLSHLLRTAGLGGAKAELGGATLVGWDLAAGTRDSLVVVGVALLAVDLLMLVALLRSLVAPLFLLAASALSVLAALGLTVSVFPFLSGGFTFYVPMAVGVLLLSFGSDYNIFLVGRIWEQAASGGGLRAAIVAALPEASATVTKAGIALAGTFALLAVVPLRSFLAFGFAMAAGILLDTFLVRSMIVPAGLRLLGTTSGSPNRRLMDRFCSDAVGSGAGQVGRRAGGSPKR